MSNQLTTKEVCARYNIDRATLQRHVADGCPVAGKAKSGKKGKPSWLFDPAQIDPWMLAHGKQSKALVGAALRETPAQAPQAAKVEPELGDPELMRKKGIVGSLERARMQEMVLSGKLSRANREGHSDSEIAALAGNLTKIRAELRQMEMVVLEYQQKTGELVNYASMERLFVQLASGTRERVEAVPNELTPVLREYLRDPDDAGKVYDEIKAAISRALTALPEELPE